MGSLGDAVACSLRQDLLLVSFAPAVVIELVPLIFCVVLHVSVVVAAVCCAVVDAHAVQVVRSLLDLPVKVVSTLLDLPNLPLQFFCLP